MAEQDDAQASRANTEQAAFIDTFESYNRPGAIVTLGHYYAEEPGRAAKALLRESRGDYVAGDPAINAGAMRRNLGWTTLITALNADRQWAQKRLFELLNPMISPDIALVVVPTHTAYQAFWPMRALARRLSEHGRLDATSCLVRHQTIKRITFGGPSNTQLHRQTIRVENAELIQHRQVLLLDDITKSGASLITCRSLLLEAGADTVQAMALGRVVAGKTEPA